MKRSIVHALPTIAFAALPCAALLTAGILCLSATPRAQAADEPLADSALGVTVSGPIISETPVTPSFDAVGGAQADALSSAETPASEEPPSLDAALEESGISPLEDVSKPDAESESSDRAPTDEVSYPGGSVGFDADGIPVGPDMTRAEESGLPMAGGVSANPAETLLEEAERRFEDGSSPEVIAVDGATGRLEYGA